MKQKITYGIRRVSTIAASTIAAALIYVPGLASEKPVAVSADIAPLWGLVASVMDGIATPQLIIAQGADPHHYSLRPSQARALASATLIFQIDASLTPWLQPALSTLADDAEIISMMGSAGTRTLGIRTNHVDKPLADADTHKDEHATGHGDQHDEQMSDAARRHAQGHDSENQHDHSRGHENDHQHNGPGRSPVLDPHGWLDPQNARHWLHIIAETLGRHDPANAQRYSQNADRARADISAQLDRLQTIADQLQGRQIFAAHDSWQYLEARLGLAFAGSFSDTENSPATPNRLTDLRQKANRSDSPVCVISSAANIHSYSGAVLSGRPVITVQADPLGSQLALGPDIYSHILGQIEQALDACSATAE